MDLIDELKLAADIVSDEGMPEDGALYIRAIGEIRLLRLTLQWIIDADWRSWDEEVRTPEDFVQWAKSRARCALTHNA